MAVDAGRTPEGRHTEQGDTLVIKWNKLALEVVRETKLGAPMVSRALAVLHTAMYDAWAAYDASAVGTSLGDVGRQPQGHRTPENMAIAISYAAYGALMDLFPDQVHLLDAQMDYLGLERSLRRCDTDTPQGVGTLAAEAVVRYRHGDGSNQLGDLHPGAYSDWTGYRPINTPDEIRDPNRWQPLRIPDGHGGSVVQSFLGPQWGLVQPFAVAPASERRPSGPRRLPVDGFEYVQQCHDLLEYSADLNDELKVIAEYWALGPGTEAPPGRWFQFAQYVSRRDRHTLSADIVLFFALGGALLDASILAWDAKRAFDSVRPITAIHHAFRGQKVRAWRGPYKGTGLIDGQDWQPYQEATVVTPPFPEFYSGHSTFSAAGAEVLRRFTRSDAFGASHTQAKGTSVIEAGLVPATDITLRWETFSDAESQAGASRRYGGIHFAEADFSGRIMGRMAGHAAWSRVQAYLHGAAMTHRNP